LIFWSLSFQMLYDSIQNSLKALCDDPVQNGNRHGRVSRRPQGARFDFIPRECEGGSALAVRLVFRQVGKFVVPQIVLTVFRFPAMESLLFNVVQQALDRLSKID